MITCNQFDPFPINSGEVYADLRPGPNTKKPSIETKIPISTTSTSRRPEANAGPVPAPFCSTNCTPITLPLTDQKFPRADDSQKSRTSGSHCKGKEAKVELKNKL
ncbi:unnamed protein product [Schistocephalus solidus]|uniref:Uncharacterized protein n=1 Tax=Schistocephalus solidus TaxID=70667 RepID=A0A183SE55_SCHSO|nr:unnamed protein product [Schistocephalus solidus]